MAVLNVITGLNVGGAETMLAKLLEQDADRPGKRPEVLSLLPPGHLADRIRRAGIAVHTAGMKQGIPSLGSAWRVASVGRTLAPTLVQGWMHHGNLAASLAALAVHPRPPVIWNIRHSLVDIALEKPLSRHVLRAGRLASRSASAIVYNSAVAAAQFEAFGFSADRTVVIPNGFDCALFRPCADAGLALRRHFGIAAAPLVVAMVARLHPMKDAANLVEAMSRARAMGHDLHLLMVGTGTDALPPDLAALIARALPADRVTLAGERQDVAAWLAGVDILALPSAWGEGFPNILGEAMACGVPCVATDVGDSGVIIGKCGRTVPPRDPTAFAAALGELARLSPVERAQLGAAGRIRIVENYALDRIAARYNALHDKVRTVRSRDRAATANVTAEVHRR